MNTVFVVFLWVFVGNRFRAKFFDLRIPEKKLRREQVRSFKQENKKQDFKSRNKRAGRVEIKADHSST